MLFDVRVTNDETKSASKYLVDADSKANALIKWLMLYGETMDFSLLGCYSSKYEGEIR